MKGSHWFILILVIFLGVMFVVEYNLPKKFVWNPTFSSYDYQPFGCAIFDDVVSGTWDEYYQSDWTFYNFANDTVNEPLAILAVGEELQFTKTDRDAILQLAERGNKVILAANSFSLSDTLEYKMSNGWFSMRDMKKYITEGPNRKDSVYWLVDSNSISYPAEIFEFYPQMCNAYFTKYDSLIVPVASARIDSFKMRADSLPDCYAPVAIRRQVGKGEIILISTPLLFTNYGMLDGKSAVYLFRLLSVAKGMPLYRTEAYNKSAHEQQSPFRYFLSQPALRWGLYLTMITLVLFMIFTARRRQRPIPVVHQPENKTLEFTELVGTLYFQKKDHGDLVRKKFTYFAEALRRAIQVDVEDDSNDRLLCRKIASKTGMDETELARLFAQLRPVISGDRNPREEEMKEWIDEMNKILTML